MLQHDDVMLVLLRLGVPVYDQQLLLRRLVSSPAVGFAIYGVDGAM